MAIIQIEGVRVTYDEYGQATSGGNVVLVHAFPLNRTMWDPLVAELRGTFHLVVPDMRGSGASEIPEGATTMERMADDVHALVETLEITPFTLVGLSMGGYVALEYARKYPGELRALVLADTKAAADTAEEKAARYEMVKTLAADGPAAIAEAMLPKLLSEEARADDSEIVVKVRRMIETTSAAGIAAALVGMAERPDSTDLLSSIAVPTLVIVGSKDAGIPLGTAEAMAAAIPGAKLAVIEGSGHLSSVEKPLEFSQAVKDFAGALAPVPKASPAA